MDDSQNSSLFPFPEYYLSTSGPQLSKTIINIALNILPAINFILASHGVNILPAAVNQWVTLIVFAYFSIQAGIGYIRSRKILGAQILELKQKLGAMNTGSSGQTKSRA